VESRTKIQSPISAAQPQPASARSDDRHRLGWGLSIVGRPDLRHRRGPFQVGPIRRPCLRVNETAATLDVLDALRGPDDELYGLKIAQNAGRKTGSVYPILARLEEAAWVESCWERDERGDRGPRRRFYRLSPEGLAAARALLAEHRGTVRQRTGQGRSAWRTDPVAGYARLRQVPR
jgi:PadR family transcriptional regulator, regulatory protein PadR